MDIVERLRKRKAYNAEYDFHGNEIIGDDPDEDCIEAANEIERLREALKKLSCNCASNCDWESDDICPSWVARAALKGDE